MPVDMSRYPANWPDIRTAILNRSQHRCERCGTPNYSYVFRWIDQDGPGETYHKFASDKDAVGLRCGWHGWDEEDADGDPIGEQYYDTIRPSKVVLTIAHVNDPDPMNCDPSNLQALCQRCHNRLDAPMRAKHAAETRKRKVLALTGQSLLEL
jgi:5-methylcytosine-specific restriction endonuclease McrA